MVVVTNPATINFVMVGIDFMVISICILCGFMYFMIVASDFMLSGLSSKKKMMMIGCGCDERDEINKTMFWSNFIKMCV